MSEGILRMLAERAEIEAQDAAARDRAARPDPEGDAIMALIELAAPFLDAGPIAATAWPASAILKLGYCVIATSNLAGAEFRAERFVGKSLVRARNLYRAGFYANPFAAEPRPRA